MKARLNPTAEEGDPEYVMREVEVVNRYPKIFMHSSNSIKERRFSENVA